MMHMEVNTATTFIREITATKKWRSGSESILPQHISDRQRTNASGYDIYPYHSLGEGKIFSGYPSLADWIIREKNVRIDGYIGIFWDVVQGQLTTEFEKKGVSVKWTYLA